MVVKFPTGVRIFSNGDMQSGGWAAVVRIGTRRGVGWCLMEGECFFPLIFSHEVTISIINGTWEAEKTRLRCMSNSYLLIREMS